MSSPYTPDEALTDFLAAIAAGLGPFSCRLLLAPPFAVRGTTAAAVTEAGYVGYLAQAFTWTPGTTAGGPNLTGPDLTFLATGDSAPGTQGVVGWYVTGGAGRLIEMFLFASHVDFALTGAAVIVTPFLPARAGL